jgi:hypothetical protein
MGRFDSLKENTFSSASSSAAANRRGNNSETDRSNNRSHTRPPSRSLNIANRSNFRERKSKTIDLNNIMEEEFPELIQNDTTNKDTVATDSSWQNAMKQREEEENRIKEGSINQHDPKYWRGATWKGPMLIRQKNYPDSWYKYIDKAVKGHASSYLFPFRETEYSRDGTNWYSSWNDTFSEEQLQRIEYEEEEQYKMEQYRILEEYGDRLEEEAEKYYEEVGELNGYAIAYLERMEYEKYAEKYDNEMPLEENEDDIDSDDYLEDDN